MLGIPWTWTCEQSGSFKASKNYKETYACNQSKTVDISGTGNEEKALEHLTHSRHTESQTGGNGG